MSDAPIIVIDILKQNDSTTASSIYIHIELEGTENCVTAYCLLIYYYIIEFFPFNHREVLKFIKCNFS